MTNSAGVTAVDIERLRMWPDALKNQRMIGLPDTLRDDLRSAADEIERLRALPPPEPAAAMPSGGWREALGKIAGGHVYNASVMASEGRWRDFAIALQQVAKDALAAAPTAQGKA